MSSHFEYYGDPSAGGVMLPAGGDVKQGMEDSMQGIPMQPGRSLSVCSVSSCGADGPNPAHGAGNGLYSNCNDSNPQEEIMNDELLMSLFVPQLNKRLHGNPQKEMSQVLKKRRRTLKNCNYARNCRKKRLQQNHDLETTNRNLQRMKNELVRVQQERDLYKQRHEMLRTRQNHHHNHNHSHHQQPTSQQQKQQQQQQHQSQSQQPHPQQQQQQHQPPPASPEVYL